MYVNISLPLIKAKALKLRISYFDLYRNNILDQDDNSHESKAQKSDKQTSAVVEHSRQNINL